MYDSMHVLETILCRGTCMLESNKGGEDQKLIQSSTIPNPGHHTRKCQKHKKTSHTSLDVSPFPQQVTTGDNKAIRNRQDSITKVNTKHK